MTRRSLSSRTVQVLREDVSQMIRRVATRVHERHEAALKKQREAEQHYQYEGNEVVVCLVRRVSENPPRFIASTATEIGKVGIVSTHPDEDRFLESSMRMQLVRAYYASGHGKFDECRERASKTKIIVERSFVLGSAANGGIR